jgi:hypothetical protein
LNVIAQKSADYFGLLPEILQWLVLLTRIFLWNSKGFPNCIGT